MSDAPQTTPASAIADELREAGCVVEDEGAPVRIRRVWVPDTRPHAFFSRIEVPCWTLVEANAGG